MIIDIEGTDGSGKQTQTKKLYEYLVSVGKKCKLISFPNYESDSSAPVKMYLGGKLENENKPLNFYQTSTLYAVDRLVTMQQINVQDYDYVLFDRYVPSNMIHQAIKAKNVKEMNKYLKWIKNFEYGKLNLPQPDIILFLDVPVEISSRLASNRTELKNGQSKDILEQDKNHLKKAYFAAKYVAKKYKWTTINCTDNNGIMPIDKIHEEILTKLHLK